MNFLNKLIYNGTYDLNLDIIQKIYFKSYPNDTYNDDDIDINKLPIKVIIG